MADVVRVRPGPVLEHDLPRLRDPGQVLQVTQLVDAGVAMETGPRSDSSLARLFVSSFE